MDPDLTNNAVVEATTVECPSMTVNKTVSFDGTCPGRDVTVINETGQPVTFCYEITNTGTTYLDTIQITDTLADADAVGSRVIYTDTIRYGGGPARTGGAGRDGAAPGDDPASPRPTGTAGS